LLRIRDTSSGSARLRQGYGRQARTALLIALLGAACTPNARVEDYGATIAAARAEKNRAFRESSDSPVPIEKRGELLPLQYFAIDTAYRVPASLRPAREVEIVEMATSTGQRRRMRITGALEFNVKGTPLSLTALSDEGDAQGRRLFIPFSDLTSGTETYAAGRYLDLERLPSGVYDLDFNRAYNPFCYYDSKYDCPYPPKSNRLPIPIRAGERLPEFGRTQR
jgi:uncharacterized protein (DUF1684 family)